MRFDAALLVAALALPAPAAVPAPGSLSWKGTLRAVHAGDGSPNLELASLEPREHLYAVGPLAHFGGEITILDGAPHLARVERGALATSHDLAGAASFLVWARVARWTPPAALAPAGGRSLDEIVEAAATRARVDTSRPFPFLLTGTFDAVDLHVLAPGPDEAVPRRARRCVRPAAPPRRHPGDRPRLLLPEPRGRLHAPRQPHAPPLRRGGRTIGPRGRDRAGRGRGDRVSGAVIPAQDRHAGAAPRTAVPRRRPGWLTGPVSPDVRPGGVPSSVVGPRSRGSCCEGAELPGAARGPPLT